MLLGDALVLDADVAARIAANDDDILRQIDRLAAVQGLELSTHAIA